MSSASPESHWTEIPREIPHDLTCSTATQRSLPTPQPTFYFSRCLSTRSPYLPSFPSRSQAAGRSCLNPSRAYGVTFLFIFPSHKPAESIPNPQLLPLSFTISLPDQHRQSLLPQTSRRPLSPRQRLVSKRDLSSACLSTSYIVPCSNFPFLDILSEPTLPLYFLHPTRARASGLAVGLHHTSASPDITSPYLLRGNYEDLSLLPAHQNHTIIQLLTFFFSHSSRALPIGRARSPPPCACTPPICPFCRLSRRGTLPQSAAAGFWLGSGTCSPPSSRRRGLRIANSFSFPQDTRPSIQAQ